MEYAKLLEEAALQQDFLTLERYLLVLGIPRLVDLLSTSNPLLKTVLLGQLSRLVRQHPHDQTQQVIMLGKDLFEWQPLSQPNPTVRQSFRYLLASYIKTQCEDGEDIQSMLSEVNRVMDVDRQHKIQALELFLTMVEVYQDDSRSKCKKHFESFYLNRFMYEAHRQLTTCVGKEYVDDEWEWAWDQDSQAVILSLKLIKALINYDFFASKQHDPTDQFMQDRSPLLIPARPSRFQKYEQFEKLKDHDLLQMLLFLHHSSDSLQIRCLCIELLCDLSRIQIKFFRAQQVYSAYCQQIMDGLVGILQIMKLQDNDDYRHALCYANNVMKTLTTFSPKRLTDQLIQSWAFNLVDFLHNHLLQRLLPIPSLFKPLFTFLMRLTLHTSQTRIKEQIQSLMRSYTDCLDKLCESRSNGVELDSCGILAVDLAMQVDPLADCALMEDYLVVFRDWEVQVGDVFSNQHERLWKVYQKFQYAVEKFRESEVRGKESRRRYAERNITDCFRKVEAIDQQAINPLYIQNVYIYMMSKVFKCKNPLELVRECSIPLVKIIKKVRNRLNQTISAGHRSQIIVEDCIKCIYVENMDREDLYEMMVNYIQANKGNPSKQKELNSMQTLCYLLVQDDILQSFLLYICPNLTLQLYNKLLKSLLKHRTFRKFPALLQLLLTQHYSLLTATPLSISILDKILRIDCTNQQATTNKATMFRLLSPVLNACVKEMTGRERLGKVVRVVCKLICYGEMAKAEVLGDWVEFAVAIGMLVAGLATASRVGEVAEVIAVLKWVVDKGSQIFQGNQHEVSRVLVKYLPQTKDIILNLIKTSQVYSSKLVPLCLEYLNTLFSLYEQYDTHFLQQICQFQTNLVQNLLKNLRLHKCFTQKINIFMPYTESDFEIAKTNQQFRSLQVSQLPPTTIGVSSSQSVEQLCLKPPPDQPPKIDQKPTSNPLSESFRLSDQNKDIVHDIHH